MAHRLLLIIFPLIASIIFAGCSFEDIFAKLATTNEEQGASEEYTRSKIIEAKQQKINQMKQQYPDNIELKNVSQSNQGIGTAFRKLDKESTQIYIEVMLPNVGRQMYEVWLRESLGKEKIRLGVLQFNQTDDYSFSYTAPQNLSKFATISISREAVPDDIQETVIMTGTFPFDN